MALICRITYLSIKKILKSVMTPDQIAEAQKLAKAYAEEMEKK